MHVSRWPRLSHLAIAGALLFGARAAAQPAPRPAASPNDSLEALRSAKLALQRFQRQFDLFIEAQRFKGRATATCTEKVGDACLDPDNGGLPYGAFSAKPIFQRTADSHVPVIDRALMARLNTDFLKALDKAALIIPGDQWIVGQRVRRLVDIADSAGARTAAERCRANSWWCAALAGYVATEVLEFDRADSAFATMTAAMPDSASCRWGDVRRLLDKDSRSWFGKLDCAGRRAALSHLWWLSDPLYLLPGNEREREHYARWVYYLLEADAAATLAANPGREFVERSSPATIRNGSVLQLDALQEIVLRMGIPGYSFPAETGEDIAPVVAQGGVVRTPTVSNRMGESGMAAIRRMQGSRASLLPPPAVSAGQVYQFPVPRYHFIPGLDALEDPLRAPRDAWAPRDVNALELFHPHYGTEFAALDHQIAYFRRGDSALLVAAADISRDTALYSRGVMNAALIRATDEHTPPQIWRTPGDVMFLWAVPVPLDTALVDIEVLTQGLSISRTRYASGPRPLPAQRVGVSDLLVLDGAQDPLPTTIETAMLAISGGVRIPILSTLGVFWEIYGLRDRDSVTFTVAATREQSSSAAGRLTRALGIGGGTDSTHVQFTETVTTGGERVGRSVNLDLSQLPLGFYALRVTVAVAGQEPVTAQQRIEIVPRLY